MAIYTRFGTRVNLTEASCFPVWIEDRGGEIKWHLKVPKLSKRTREVTEMPVWFVRAVNDDERDDHGPRGRPICDGKLICINDFRADDGFGEVEGQCERLNVAHSDLVMKWIHTSAGPASKLFPLADPAALIF